MAVDRAEVGGTHLQAHRARLQGAREALVAPVALELLLDPQVVPNLGAAVVLVALAAEVARVALVGPQGESIRCIGLTRSVLTLS